MVQILWSLLRCSIQYPAMVGSSADRSGRDSLGKGISPFEFPSKWEKRSELSSLISFINLDPKPPARINAFMIIVFLPHNIQSLHHSSVQARRCFCRQTLLFLPSLFLSRRNERF